MQSSRAGPVDDEGEGPFDNVVKGEGLQATESHVCLLGVDDRLLLFGLDCQHAKQLSDDVMRHQVDLSTDEERHGRRNGGKIRTGGGGTGPSSVRPVCVSAHLKVVFERVCVGSAHP